MSQNVLEESRTAIRTEAAHFGIHSLDSCCSNVAGSDTAFLELIRYRKYALDPSRF
jgi:hypothetical protein